MWGQKRVLPRSDCISVPSMVLNVQTVVWLEIPIAPGMVSPALDITLQESTPRGNSTHYKMDPSLLQMF